MHVLAQLPPKRRQIIRLLLKSSDIVGAKAATREVINCDHDRNAAENNTHDILGEEETDGKHEYIFYLLFVVFLLHVISLGILLWCMHLVYDNKTI